jgi:four helix bundle protein
MAKIENYRGLVAWQKSMNLAEQVYLATRTFPKEELYGLTSQLRRAAVSIPSNLAEGHARNTSKEFVHYLGIAKDSLAELETQILLASRLSFLSSDQCEALQQSTSEVGRLLNGLRRAILSPAP